jgi:hypothetical protein
MPGHFTHIYTARRVSDNLLSGQVVDWPPAVADALKNHSAHECGQVMRDWEKFTAIGAIGPDLFYFLQDYNTATLGPLSDELMLAFATYYFYDAASEDDWEPLLIILDQVNSTLAALLRFLIKLQKIWQTFLDGWNQTIGPVVSSISEIPDALTGGLISQFQTVLDEFKTALITIGEEELTTYADIFSQFNTCVQKGFSEKLFLWSDMSHYRRPSAFARALVQQAETLHDGSDAGGDQYQQFLAFSLGYITHLGTDTVGHSFVNEQCGGPYRDHPQRHHLIENHIDAWNYSQTGDGGVLKPDPWGHTETYPDLTMSAMWFAVQLTPDNPHGQQRPDPLPDDPDARTKALDVDGEMPDWMAESIVKAMISAFTDHDHPLILQGDAFQSSIDSGLLTKWVQTITGHGLDKPFGELLDDIAPKPSFPVPKGFPLPWQIKTVYKIMYSFYRLSYNGTWELQKPPKPDFIITPPASDIENVLQPPDLSGIDPSNPVDDVCGVFVALFDWATKLIESVIQLANDLIKMLTSPLTYVFRLGLYDLAMMIWDLITKTHEIMAHTGFFIPHAQQLYPGGELRLPNEIDLPMITLGGTVDQAFLQALAGAFDPLGNLDQDPNAIGVGHSVSDPNYPYYPVLRYHVKNNTWDGWEFRRPWAYPSKSLSTLDDGNPDTYRPTPTETYNPSKHGDGPDKAYKPLRPGPYPVGTRPDVFFRLDAPVNANTRSDYESAQTPWETDQLNETNLRPDGLRESPIGDPIPFSVHLISQIANDTGYATQFNLDSDRAFAYLTWDWIRNDPNAPGGQKNIGTGILGLTYATPVEPPENDQANPWAQGNNPLQLQYVDAPPKPAPPPLQ